MKTGNCPRGAERTYTHPEMEGWVFVAGAKAKTKAKKDKKMEDKSKTPCKFFLAGHCVFGDKCFSSHDAGKTIAPLESNTNKPAAKSKAKDANAPLAEQVSGNV